MHRYVWVLLAVFLAACNPFQSTRASEAYTASMTVDSQNDRRLLFTVEEVKGNRPAELTGAKQIHTHIVPADLSTLYHEHPERVAAGQYGLDLQVPPGEYDLWVEITDGNDHAGAYLKRIPITVKSAAASPAATHRLAAEPKEMELRLGEQSHMNFLLTLDGQPVEHYGKFMNVEVHAFAVSQDRQWLMHDHAHLAEGGMVDAHAAFPKAGEYVVFVQPTALDGQTEVREVLRHTVTVPAK